MAAGANARATNKSRWATCSSSAATTAWVVPPPRRRGGIAQSVQAWSCRHAPHPRAGDERRPAGTDGVHGSPTCPHCAGFVDRANSRKWVGPGLGQDAWGGTTVMRAVQDCGSRWCRRRRIEPAGVGAAPVGRKHRADAAPERPRAHRRRRDDPARPLRRRATSLRYAAVAVLERGREPHRRSAGRVAVCAWGNPGYASGGMGDVLTGGAVVAALLAQGLSAGRCGDRRRPHGGRRRG